MHVSKSTLLVLGTTALLAAVANAQTSSRTTPPQPNPEAPTTGPGAAARPEGGSAAPSPPAATSSSGSTASPMAGGQSGARNASGSSGQMAEQQFLARLAHDNESEIEMAKLAKEQASSPRVKKFAEQLVRDHEHAGDLVKDFAKKKNFDLKASSSGMAMKDQDKVEMDKLKALKGADFDRQFVKEMISDHEKTIKDMTTARTQFNDPELTKLLNQLLPTLRQHLATARELDRGSSKARSSPRSR